MRTATAKTDDREDLTGRRAIVTGANSGIGWATALGLARAGASVILAGRTSGKVGHAVDRIRALVPGAEVTPAQLDLASLTSIADFAATIDKQPLDLLINNAGVMAPPRYRQTADGFELQFGTNHLGHFALTGRLLPNLLAAGSSRVVTVSSLAHAGGSTRVLAGSPADTYRPAAAYANSKLANLLFGLELQRRSTQHRTGLVSTVAHPGLSATRLFTSRDGLGANPLIRGLGHAFGRLLFASPTAGARATLTAVRSAPPGSYTGPQWLGESRGPVGPARISPLAADPILADSLWDLSEEWTGVRYAWPKSA